MSFCPSAENAVIAVFEPLKCKGFDLRVSGLEVYRFNFRRSRKGEIVEVCMVIKHGEGKVHVADVYLLQRRQVETVLHS